MRKQIVLVLCMLILSVSTIVSQSKTADRQSQKSDPNLQKLADISSEIEKNKERIKPKKEKQRHAERSLSKLAKDLRYTELKLRRAKRQYRVLKKEEKKVKKDLAKMQKDYDEKRDAFAKRMLQIYKNRDLGIVEFLFSQKDFIAAVSSSYYFDKIMKRDIELIQSFKSDYAKLIGKKKKLYDRQKGMVLLRNKIQEREKGLLEKKRKQKQTIARLKSQIAKLERENAELLRASKAITQLIRKSGLGEQKYYGTGSFIKPVHGWLSSRFGTRIHPIFKRKIHHAGIDLAAPKGYKIRAADSGVVIHAGAQAKYRGYGKITVISHGRRAKDGKLLATFYAHQSRIIVKKGDFVKKGDEIGRVGASGYATGPHLHFEIRENGRPVNPLKYLKL